MCRCVDQKFKRGRHSRGSYKIRLPETPAGARISFGFEYAWSLGYGSCTESLEEECVFLPVKLKSTDVYSCNDASTSTAGRSEASSNGSRTFLGSKSISWSSSTTCPNLSTIHRVAAEIRRGKVGACWHELEYLNKCCVSPSKLPETRESASSTH